MDSEQAAWADFAQAAWAELVSDLVAADLVAADLAAVADLEA